MRNNHKHHRPHEDKPLISLLVPFYSDDPHRLRVWKWLERYWRDQLPGVEIVVGRDRLSRKKWYRRHPLAFSKTAAVNDAFRRSHGDIIVILDADCYMPGEVIQHCAGRIRKAMELGVHEWFVPYHWIFRLTLEATEGVLSSDPANPTRFTTPPDPDDVEGTDGSGWGRRFGALIQIMPREAFELVGGMDERFRGWGGEDIAFLRALDTLWGPHKNTPNDVLHLWHPKILFGKWTDPRGKTWDVRIWRGQTSPQANDELAQHYSNATGNKKKMRFLVDQGR